MDGLERKDNIPIHTPRIWKRYGFNWHFFLIPHHVNVAEVKVNKKFYTLSLKNYTTRIK